MIKSNLAKFFQSGDDFDLVKLQKGQSQVGLVTKYDPLRVHISPASHRSPNLGHNIVILNRASIHHLVYMQRRNCPQNECSDLSCRKRAAQVSWEWAPILDVILPGSYVRWKQFVNKQEKERAERNKQTFPLDDTKKRRGAPALDIQYTPSTIRITVVMMESSGARYPMISGRKCQRKRKL